MNNSSPMIVNSFTVPSLTDFRRRLSWCWTGGLEAVITELADKLADKWSDPLSTTGEWLRSSILTVATDVGCKVTDIDPLDVATGHVRWMMAKLACSMDPMFADDDIDAPTAELLIGLILRTAVRVWDGSDGEITVRHGLAVDEVRSLGHPFLVCGSPPGYRFLAGSADLGGPDPLCGELVDDLALTSGPDPARIVVVCQHQVVPSWSGQVPTPPS
jgi:hypothetical protein